jgi:hypothetical protein
MTNMMEWGLITNAFLRTTVCNNVSVLDFIVHYLLHVSAPTGGHLQVKCTQNILRWPLCMSTDPLSQLYKIEHRNIVAYGGFKKSISGYTRNRMQNPTIKRFNKLGGSLSPQHGTSSGCGWRNSLQLWRVAANISNKQPWTNDKGSAWGWAWG